MEVSRAESIVLAKGAVMGGTVVIPVKDLAIAKSRLRPQWGVQTSALALAMARDVAQAALDAALVDRVIIVTNDPLASATLAGDGTEVWPDEPNGGLNAALTWAANQLSGQLVLAVASDCPCLTGSDLDQVVAAAASYGRVFSADVRGTGTTSLAALGELLAPRFGPASRAAHRASGATELVGSQWHHLRRDVDTEVDLWDAQRLGVGRHTAALIAARREPPAGT